MVETLRLAWLLCNTLPRDAWRAARGPRPGVLIGSLPRVRARARAQESTTNARLLIDARQRARPWASGQNCSIGTFDPSSTPLSRRSSHVCHAHCPGARRDHGGDPVSAVIPAA